MTHLKQLRLEERRRPTAKGMEYDYYVYDGDKTVVGWHESSKRNYTEILFKMGTHGGYLKTDDTDNAVAVARYSPEQHYAREAEKAAEYVKNLKVDGEGILVGEF